MKGICGGIGFLLIMILAVCLDGLMDAYGMKTTILVGLAVLTVSFVLVEISNLPKRS